MAHFVDVCLGQITHLDLVTITSGSSCLKRVKAVMIPLISDSGIGITFLDKRAGAGADSRKEPAPLLEQVPLLELALLLESAPFLESASLSHESHISREVMLYTFETYSYFQI